MSNVERREERVGASSRPLRPFVTAPAQECSAAGLGRRQPASSGLRASTISVNDAIIQGGSETNQLCAGVPPQYQLKAPSSVVPLL